MAKNKKENGVLGFFKNIFSALTEDDAPIENDSEIKSALANVNRVQNSLSEEDYTSNIKKQDGLEKIKGDTAFNASIRNTRRAEERLAAQANKKETKEHKEENKDLEI